MNKLHPLIEELREVRASDSRIAYSEPKNGDLSKIFNFAASGRHESVPRVAATIKNSSIGQSWRVPNTGRRL